MSLENILIRVSNSISERVNKFMLDPDYRLNCKETNIGLEAEKHSIIYYALERLRNCEKFRLENLDGKPQLQDGSDAITGYSQSGSSYEQGFYNKEKTVGSSFGTGLSTNALKGVSADVIDGKEYIMPNIINDDIIENVPGSDRYMPVYFDENNNLSVAHSICENYLTLGKSGKTVAYCTTKDETVFKGRVTAKGNVILFLNLIVIFKKITRRQIIVKTFEYIPKMK